MQIHWEGLHPEVGDPCSRFQFGLGFATDMQHIFTTVCLTLFLGLAQMSAHAADLDFVHRQLTAKPTAGTKEIPFSFAFTNRSTRTITITEVKPTCGCTVVTLGSKTYPPGESGTIPVVFTISPTMFGLQRKQIHVHTDNPAEQDITLSLEVALPEGPTLDRRLLSWNQGAALSTQVVTLTIPPYLSWSVTGVADRQQFFDAQIQPTEDPKVIRIAVTPRQTERSCIGNVLITFDGGQVMQVFGQIRKAPQQP